MSAPEPSVLELKGFGVAFGAQVVLASIDLEVPRRGMVNLVGDAGCGKSTLLRTLAGANDAQPALQTWGSALYRGEPLGPVRPALVHQNLRLLTSTVREHLASAMPDRARLTRPEQAARIAELLDRLHLRALGDDIERSVVSLSRVEQRLLAIGRAALGGAELVCLDEPTAGLDALDAQRVLDLVGCLAHERAVLQVTHNQSHARALGGRIALLAGGRIHERRRVVSFFESPASEPAKRFVRTGRSGLPSPDARPEDLDASIDPPPPLPPESRVAVSRAVGPRGFYWLDPGRLGGLPRPGIVADLEHDLTALGRLGVTFLVTLEEEFSLPIEPLARHGLRALHFPIDDMRAPSLAAASDLCREIELLVAQGEVVALHCRAGKGRTGTMLACQLIWQGASALDALDRARAINPSWVQSQAQADFLMCFEESLRRRSGEANQD